MNTQNYRLIVAIDVGGTETKYNLYDLKSQKFIINTAIDKSFQLRCEENRNGVNSSQNNNLILDDFVETLGTLIENSLSIANKAMPESYTIKDIYGIGICVPTQVDSNGYIKRIPAFRIGDFNLIEKIQNLPDLSTKEIKFKVIHDVLMHTLGMYRALKIKNLRRDIESLMVVSAGTAAGVGIRLDALNTETKLIYGSEFNFPANILRGYGIRWSIRDKESEIDTYKCRDLGWKVARVGIENTFVERVDEILGSPTAIAIINGENVENLYDKIIEECKEGYHLANRIVVECFDSDNSINCTDDFSQENINKKIENIFKNVLNDFIDSKLIKFIFTEGFPIICKRKESVSKKISNKKINSLSIDSAANDGDVFARKAIEECANNLGLCLSIIIPIIQPEYLIFAGGVSNSKVWMDSIQQTIKENTPNWYQESYLSKCFLTPNRDEIRPSYCNGQTEVQLLGAIEMISPIDLDK